MNFKNFDNSPAITNLVSEYETSHQEGMSVFYDETVFLQLIDYYAEESMIERALEVADEAIRCHEFSASLYIRKAALLIRIREEDEALDILDRAEVLAPNAVDIQLLRAEALVFLGDHSEALLILEELKESADAEKLSDVYVTESLLYEKIELYDRMFYALEAALSENPDNQDALERLWLCVELSKKYKESVRLHERILDHNPYSHIAWYNLGHAYAYLGRYEDAIEAYEYAYLINERFEFAYRDCAEICFEMGYYKQALNCYNEVLEHFAPDSDLFLRIGQCYHHFGDIRKARNYFVQAALLDPVNDEVFYHIGLCYAAKEEWKKAIRFYFKAINIEDKREEYFASLAEAYFQVGRTEEADQYFREATDIAPEQAQYWFKYASFLIETGNTETALQILDEAEEYAIGTELLYCRIASLFKMDKRMDALYLLNEQLENDIEMHGLLFELVPELENDSAIKAIVSSYLH